MNPVIAGSFDRSRALLSGGALAASATAAVERACQYLLNRQTSQGYWVGEIEGDSSLESDYVLLQLWLHQPDGDGSWNPPSRRNVRRACRRILDLQQADGGWNLYPGGPSNVSASVKAYWSLLIGGLAAGDDRMRRAAARIRALGGIEGSNSYTKLYLSYFGLLPQSKVPSIPPEVFLLPEDHPVSVYSVSSWSRAMLAPLSILSATKPRREVPAGVSVAEIFSGRETAPSERSATQRFFLLLDRGIKLLDSADGGPDRQKAVAAARDWMFFRLEQSDGLAAIFPAMMNSIMALTELGYGLGDQPLKRELEHFENLAVDDERGFRLQPCHSPVWDTAQTVYTIGTAQQEPDAATKWALGRAADWLLSKQARSHGDWAVRQPHATPGGWFFEYSNAHYPDTDDTAEVLLALEHARGADRAAQRESERRALEWLASMQSSDGGWAAFDVDNTKTVLTQLPFSDHNAMLDPTCPDITGRVVEALSRRAPRRYQEAIRRGRDYLLRTQKEDGCWYGRWGVNYLYGTCFAVRGLRASGIGSTQLEMLRAGEWIRSYQNPDGGWGESPSSYDDPRLRAIGESTPSQTAWALLGLFATGDSESGSVKRGVRYLLDRQTPEGTWREGAFTGTGFPGVFYLRYHMYPQYFPVMALEEFVREQRSIYR